MSEIGGMDVLRLVGGDGRWSEWDFYMTEHLKPQHPSLDSCSCSN